MKTTTDYKTLTLDKVDGLRADKNQMQVLPFSKKALEDRKEQPDRSKKSQANVRGGKKF